MKVRITYTVDLTEDERKAVALSMGKELGHLATYEDIQQFYRNELDTVVRDATAFPLREYYRVMGSKFEELAKNYGKFKLPTE